VFFDPVYLLFALPGLLLSMWASYRVRAAFDGRITWRVVCLCITLCPPECGSVPGVKAPRIPRAEPSCPSDNELKPTLDVVASWLMKFSLCT
jgi:hypothetical protein